ncbi:HAD family hydrolase [Streptomyces albipurpureus]|uniref:HAD family phosphatase n=1 Tax=Streptomyces albipurpureus TaxID=2897419 RepID=A0ABT0UH79_9ACTN|nr:HAD family phosphatase [Streptomyces sp. CWNU-1]MCM2387399.1 HAD family phosphatase [Streptomyces sp. CWNU-1]
MPEIFPWTPTAIVFDCDGTLMDSERHWQMARDRVLQQFDIVVSDDFAELTKGVHYTECGQLMAAEIQRPDLEAVLTADLLDTFRSLVAQSPETTPGAAELVARAAEFAPLAVASNCPRDVVEDCLAAAGLLRHFSHVVVPEHNLRPKPHPDVYLTAAAACQSEPSKCLAVEDSLCGIRSAVRAGLRVLGVGPLPDRESLAMADHWVLALNDRPLTSWMASRALSRAS